MKLPKVYEPAEYENDIYALWEKSESFVPKNRGGKGSYSIVMPPPNANANLHIGYGLVAALEDIPTRYHRMKGESTLLLPGADHAGFETQVVYEKQLAKEGKSRFDFSRDELHQQIWDFVARNRSNFETQFRTLGISCDWSRFTFTLDEKIVKQAYVTFKKMWDQGLIYRGERLVNFCTFHGTAFADIEVEFKETKGTLWHIRYPLTDGSGEVVVATTRPETMLGDTAVAVHPADARFKKFIGKTVKLPLTKREIPIIADEFVEREFGTGAVKITPAHDQNDYEVAKRHDLPMMSIIDHEGNISAEAPANYRGLSVEKARDKVVDDLTKQGLLVKVEVHEHNVGHCYKCGTVIQPLLREQWFVDMQPLAKPAIEALKANKITFYPSSKKDQLVTYLDGLRDWNISRQIAWGIPIPAFVNVDNPDDWVFDERVSEETIQIGQKTYKRDPDVFDTWFSSSSWPYATLGHPDSEDFKQFYPLNLMETGGEILYPWVSRMIMLGLYVTGDVPFTSVYIHGYVMAEDGAKMSKSLGNVIDPLDIIKKYGSDALRMGLIAGRAPAVNRGFDVTKVEGARNFANKLWNIARFIEDKVGDDANLRLEPKAETDADHWLLSKLQQSTEVISKQLDTYRYADAYDTLYHMVWDDVADWYIETSKAAVNKGLLAFALETILKLAHPFAPFVTETIWQTLAWEKDSVLATAQWPEVPKGDKNQAAVFEEIKQMVVEIRFIKSALHALRPSLYYIDAPFLAHNSELLKKLAGLGQVKQVADGRGLNLSSTKFLCWLDIDDDSIQKYIIEIADKKADKQQEIKQLQDRLANKEYVKHAPRAIVKQTKDQLAAAQTVIETLEQEHTRFVNK